MLPLTADYIARANRLLNLHDFSDISVPLSVMENVATPSECQQYVLRMMVRSPEHALSIPPELEWLRETIVRLDALQKSHQLHNPYIYVTVRHGALTSTTDDLWHVDGFSMRKPHTPEQNYVCVTDNAATEFLIKQWNIPETFDPFKHNIHHYFNDHQQGGRLLHGIRGIVYAIDPYCVHRRPTLEVGTMRTFWRISFLPIEIEDDTCTQNPLLPVKTYGTADIRTTLARWTPACDR